MRHRARRGIAATVTLAALVGGVLVAGVPARADGPRYQATIRRTTDGVAHITADDLGSAVFGQGYASAQDHACTLADQILKIRSERAKWYGPGEENEQVSSDFAWKAIGIHELARREYGREPADVKTLVEGFSAGWNAYLRRVGNDGLTGWCRGADWVQPISPKDLYAYARSIALNASGGRLTSYLGSAQPPAAVAPPPATPTGAASTGSSPSATTAAIGASPGQAQRLGDGFEPAPELASNGWAIGSRRSATGGGMLLANPHFPWEGELRFWETHLTVPGEVDVYGAQLIGLPGVGIGFNRDVAWTHTVSAGNRFTAYVLTLVPGKPTSYQYDGRERAMTSREESVEVRRPDGSTQPVTRTLWFSHYGPILDFPGVGWTAEKTVTYRDANIGDDELLSQYLAMDRAGSLAELRAAHRRYQGVPLFNTIAVGKDGTAWYADTSATPNLSDEAIAQYEQSLENDFLAGAAAKSGAVLLDGSTSVNEWVKAPGARDPGLVPYRDLPMTTRRDYVFNANDSFWLPNADHLIEGDYSPLHGRQDTPRSPRTRENAVVLRDTTDEGPSGADGRFSLAELRAAALLDRGYTSRALRDEVVARCRGAAPVSVPALAASDGTEALPAATVDLGPACNVIEEWDGTYDVDARGAHVWRELVSRFAFEELIDAGPLWETKFDPDEPVDTPSGLAPAPATGDDPVLVNLARAVQVIQKAGVALDAPLGEVQVAFRTDARIGVPGGNSADGTTNIVTPGSLGSSTEPTPERPASVAPRSSLTPVGYPITYGTSFLMTVAFGERGPRAYAILTYGETGDRESPLFEVQTERFSDKDWRRVAFSAKQIADDPDLTTTKVRSR